MNEKEFELSLKELNIILKDEEKEKFKIYKNLIQEYNKKFNLTSILDDENIYLKHFFDSLYLMSLEEIKKDTSLLDIGTGAGFPGIPLAIINSQLKVTLLESNNKKCNFLNIVKDKLNLNNIEIINMRAEDYAKNNREKFDIATSRAVANLSILAELEIPTVKINGFFIPLKSSYEEELIESKKKIETLGGTIKKVITYNLPIENSKRSIIIIEKVKITDKKYPRQYSKIIKEIIK